jgi:hypothetical protein
MKMLYKGGGFIVGVPARNLSTSEVNKYGDKRLLASELYYYEQKKKQTRRPSSIESEPVIEEKEIGGYE